jgi:hypothetical protein
VRTVPRISYARSADGVSLAFTTAGHGPALVYVPWVPFSNFRMEWQSAFLSSVFERHVANLYRKIGARGRADATAYALRSGLA